MKLTYKKDHGRLGRKGETFEVRHEDQAQYFIDNGIAEKVESKDNTTTAAPKAMTTTNTIEPAKKAEKLKA